MDCSAKLKLSIPPDPFPIYCQVHGIRMQDCRGNNNAPIPSFIQSHSEGVRLRGEILITAVEIAIKWATWREGRKELGKGKGGKGFPYETRGVVKERVRDIEPLSVQEVWPLRDYIKRSEGRRGRDKLDDWATMYFVSVSLGERNWRRCYSIINWLYILNI